MMGKSKYLLIMLVIALLVSGCQHSVSENKAKSIVTKELKKKYKESFDVVSIERESTGTSVGLSYSRYKLVMESKDSGIQFNAYLSLEGDEFFEYYEREKFEDDIDAEINSFDPHSLYFTIIF